MPCGLQTPVDATAKSSVIFIPFHSSSYDTHLRFYIIERERLENFRVVEFHLTHLAHALFLAQNQQCGMFLKVEKIWKGSLDLNPSASPLVKIQIMGGKVCLRCKGKTFLGIVNKLFVFKSLLTMPSMAIGVVEFSREGYKIMKDFA